MLDLDDVIARWHSAPIRPFIDELEGMPATDLRKQRRAIKSHEKNFPRKKAFSNSDQTIHDTLVESIQVIMARRKNRWEPYETRARMKGWFVKLWTGRGYKIHETFGLITESNKSTFGIFPFLAKTLIHIVDYDDNEKWYKKPVGILILAFLGGVVVAASKILVQFAASSMSHP